MSKTIGISSGKYVGVSFYGPANGVSCWDKNFNLLWYKSFNTAQFVAQEVVQLNDNSIVLLGYQSNNNSTVMKFDTAGNLIYSKNYFYSSSYSVSMNTIAPAVTGDNGFIMGGNGCGGQNILVKCDASGNIIWSNSYYTAKVRSAISIDSKGGSYTVASYVAQGVVSGSAWADVAIMNVDNAGSVVWYKQIESATDNEDPKQLVRLSNNRFALLCRSDVTAGTNMIYFFDSSLTHITYKRFISPSGISINSIAPNANGGVIGVGNLQTSSNLAVLFYTDTVGRILWKKSSLGKSGNATSFYQDITKAHGSKYVIDGKGGIEPTVTVIDENGNGLCVSDTVNIASIDSFGFSATTTGLAVIHIPITVNNITDSNSTLSFTPAIYCGILSVNEEKAMSSEVKTWPNPASNDINIEWSDFNGDEYKVTIINVLGEIVLEKPNIQNHTHINVENLRNGIYYLKFTNDSTEFAKIVVIQK